jgi:hypothetical protein
MPNLTGAVKKFDNCQSEVDFTTDVLVGIQAEFFLNRIGRCFNTDLTQTCFRMDSTLVRVGELIGIARPQALLSRSRLYF